MKLKSPEVVVLGSPCLINLVNGFCGRKATLNLRFGFMDIGTPSHTPSPDVPPPTHPPAPTHPPPPPPRTPHFRLPLPPHIFIFPGLSCLPAEYLSVWLSLSLSLSLSPPLSLPHPLTGPTFGYNGPVLTVWNFSHYRYKSATFQRVSADLQTAAPACPVSEDFMAGR